MITCCKSFGLWKGKGFSVSPPQENNNEKNGAGTGGQSEYGSLWRQLLAIIVINMVALLRGASLPSSSISTVVLISFNETEEQESSHWPRDFRITEDESTMIGISYMLGHLTSGLLANPVAEIIGRRRSLALDTMSFAAGFLLSAAGESTAALCAGRVLLGYPLVSTVYMAELVHPELRGVGAAVYATCHATGYSLILLLGGVSPSWRHAMLVLGVLALVPTLVGIYFLPESPVWLLRRERTEEALTSLRKMRGPKFDVQRELEELRTAVEKNDCKNSLTFGEALRLIRSRKFCLPFSFLFVLFLAIGWSGFAYLALNGVELFQNNASSQGEYLNEYMLNFLVSLIKIPGGLFAALFLRKFSRRPVFLATSLLVLVGHLLMAGTLSGLLPEWCAMVAITGAFFGYSAGYYSVASLLMGELLPAKLRSVGVGLVAAGEVISALSQTVAAAPMEDALGKSGLFVVFAGVVLATSVYGFIFMPETSGLTLEEIENKWQTTKTVSCCSSRSNNKDEASGSRKMKLKAAVENVIKCN